MIILDIDDLKLEDFKFWEHLQKNNLTEEYARYFPLDLQNKTLYQNTVSIFNVRDAKKIIFHNNANKKNYLKVGDKEERYVFIKNGCTLRVN
jgi:hypothetical protein